MNWDSLENMVQDRFQVAGQIEIDEFKEQLIKMRSQNDQLE